VAPSPRRSRVMTVAVYETVGAAGSAAGAGDVVSLELALAMMVLRLRGEALCRSHQPEPRQSHLTGAAAAHCGCGS
jgi:hypothetical protein